MEKQKYYKLTDQNMQTYGGCQWVMGEEKTTSGHGELCGSGWLHCYDSLLLAAFLNPIHADFGNPRLFEVKVGGKVKGDNGLKFGFTSMTLTKEIKLPKITDEQRIVFGILCSDKVYNNKDWKSWANKWLNGEDRSEAAAWAAEAAAWAAWAAAEAAARAAAWAAARAAAWAAEAAARAAARAAAWAAEAAAWAAEAAAWAGIKIDFKSIAKTAITMK
jgi:hypothetical protein